MGLSKLQQAAECIKTNDLVQAERLYKDMLISQPDCGQALLGMGLIALKVEQFDNAVSFLIKSCELLPNEILPLIRLSEAFNGVNSESDALVALEFASKNFPNNAAVNYHLGLQYTILGQLDKAEFSFKSVIDFTHEPITSFALFELTRLDSHPEQYLTILKKRLKQAKAASIELTVLHYALGNVLDSIHHYQQAWQHFESANFLQAKRCKFKTTELIRFFDDIKTTATSNVLAKRRKLTQHNLLTEVVPIFIIGLPRTGSTLLEHLLTEHQDISSAGEVPYLSREVAKFLFGQSKLHYPYSMADMTDEQLNTAAQIYLEKLSAHAEGNHYVIDKLPANFQSLGLIYKLFPNAKVLHMKRNLPDVALSVYRNYFSQSEPYFCSLIEFKQYHALYSDLMEYWNTKLPGFSHDVSYEQLVADKTNTIKNILDLCGLPSEINMRNGYQTNKVVKTLSNIQVRRAISTKPIQHWHNYKKHMQIFKKHEQLD
jgi:tetratricopeptide (TPR) repeat protein